MTPLNINIDNYSGPLEALLELAKSQKVDLEKISITQLADQFIEFINDKLRRPKTHISVVCSVSDRPSVISIDDVNHAK